MELKFELILEKKKKEKEITRIMFKRIMCIINYINYIKLEGIMKDKI